MSHYLPSLIIDERLSLFRTKNEISNGHFFDYLMIFDLNSLFLGRISLVVSVVVILLFVVFTVFFAFLVEGVEIGALGRIITEQGFALVV